MSITPRRRGIALVALVLVLAGLASCSSGGGRAEDGPDREGGRSGDAGPIIVSGSLQQLWVLDRVAAIDLDGEEIDVTEHLLALAEEGAADERPLSSTSTFTPSRQFEPQLLDVDGEVLDSVRMTGGVIDTDDGDRWVAVLATPDADEWIIGRNTSLRLDLPASAEVPEGSPIVVDHAYFQYLPIEGADGTDRSQDPLEILHRRAAVGAVAHASAGDGDTMLMTGRLGVARTAAPQPQMLRSQGGEKPRDTRSRWRERATEKGYEAARDAVKERMVEQAVERVADKMDLPADALPLLESIAEGAAEMLGPRCRTMRCIENFFDTVEKGFTESWEPIADQLDFEGFGEKDEEGGGGGPGPSPDPGPGPGPGGDAGGSGSGSGSGGGSGGGSGSGSGSGSGGSGSGGGSGGGSGSGSGSGSGGSGSGGSGSGSGSGSGGSGSGGSGGGSGSGSGGGGGSSSSGGSGSGGGSSGGSGGGSGGGLIKTDPHITTFDGRDYSFQAIGEFTAARSDELEVQVRFEPLPCDCIASITTAAVVVADDHHIEVDLYDQAVITIDGEPVELDDPEGSSTITTGPLTATRVSRGVDIVDDRTGDIVEISIGSTFLNVFVRPAETGGWSGLLGDGDGEPDNDFLLRDGSAIGSTPRPEVIEGEFADSWRLTERTSRFTYVDGESTATFADAEFPMPHPTASADELEAQREVNKKRAETVCRVVGIAGDAAMSDCVFDFTMTGSPSMPRGNRQAELAVARAERETSGADIGPSGGPASSEPSVVTFPDSETSEPDTSLVTGSGLAFVRTRHSTGDATLHAFELDSREVRWTADGIYAHCQPVLLDDGILVKSGDDEDNRSGMALLSLDDGSESAAIDQDSEGFIRGCDDLVGDGDVFVVRERVRINAYQASAEGITLAWSDDGEGLGLRQIAAVDGSLISIGTIDGDAVVTVHDLETGAERSETRVPGVDRPRIHHASDDLLAVTFEDSAVDDERSVLSLIEIAGDEVDLRWTHRVGLDDPPLPGRLTRNGDLLVGWSRHAKGDGLIARSIHDGDVVWTHEASSFTNSETLAVVDALVAIAPFGGDWIELVDAEGQTVRTLPGEDGWGHPNIFGVDGDTLIVAGNGEGGAYLTFIDL